MDSYLDSLRACLPGNTDEAKNAISRIARYFQRELTREERDVALHILFQEDTGIGSFLSSIAFNKTFKKITVEVFLLFTFLVEYYRDGVDKHVDKMKDICMACVKRSQASADEKDKAFDTLIVMLRSGSWAVDLDIPSMVSELRSMISSRPSKVSATVLRKVYTLIGVLAEGYAHDVYQYGDRLLASVLSELNSQTSVVSKVEFLVIEGCFDGLTGLLQSFARNPTTDSATCKKIAELTMRVLRLQTLSRNAAPRAALNFFARHGAQLFPHILNEHILWHETLNSWLSHGPTERPVAKQALLTLYREVARNISNSNESREILKYFINHFKHQFKESVDIDIAIKGFGLFSKPCKEHLPEEIQSIFIALTQRAEHVESPHKLVDYLESLAALIVQMDELDMLQLAILEGMTVQLIVHYPTEENKTWKPIIANSIIVTMLLLNRCSGTALHSYLKTVVYQGILRSVSHPVVQDAEILTDMGQKVTTYEGYLPLWLSLLSLNITSRGSYVLVGGLEEKLEVSHKFFDEIINSALEIISRLDLSTSETGDIDASVALSDPATCIHASHPKDFTVLVNVVDFIISFLDQLPDPFCFRKWINCLILYIVKLSTKNPLISSFYKLLAKVVLVARKVDYFSQKEADMEDPEWPACVSLLSGFLLEMATHQMQYKGDLQVACLRLMLATPPNIAAPLLHVIAPAFQCVFRIGCSVLSLAQEGLQTLQCWNREISKEKMKPLLKAVLPTFDGLLQTKELADNEDETNTHDGMDTVKKVALSLKKNKKVSRVKVHAYTETELAQLQKEVVLFLSSLDSDIIMSMLNENEDRVEVTCWQKEKYLLFPLPFPDMKPTISLDELLPRLADLALNSGDRQVRSCACELLHAVIMFMLGTEKQLEAARGGQLIPLWERLFPTIFRLACDVDLMINQLFRPLGEQLAHWYSSKMHKKSPQSSAFLLALLNGITHETDAALRDYSSICLHEYVAWSRKQGDMIEKLEPLLKQIISLCQHPSSHKRMGAALAFNSMYTMLRENERIVDVFWLDLLHALVSALAICSFTGEDRHTEDQADRATDHILRVLTGRAAVFNKASERRRVPKDFEGGTLLDAVHWLLRQCTTLNARCRHSCMKLVCRIAPHITGCHSARDVIQKIKVEGEEGILWIAEGCSDWRSFLPEGQSWEKAIVWVHSLLSRLECYIWLLNDVNIPPEELLSLNESKILEAISHFLEHTIKSPVEQAALWRPKAMEDFNIAKCTTIVRMLEFLTVVLNNGCATVLENIWGENLWKSITYCTLWPSHVGFDTNLKSVEENLPRTMENMLQALVHHASPQILENIKMHLKIHIEELVPLTLRGFPLVIQRDKVDSKDKDLITGLKTLHKVFNGVEIWSGLTSECILRTLFNGIVKSVLNEDRKAPITLGPTASSYTKLWLSLSFLVTKEIEELVTLACSSQPLCRGDSQGGISHGEHFVACFEAPLVERVLQQPATFARKLLELLPSMATPRTLTVLTVTLGSANKFSMPLRRKTKELVTVLLTEWSVIEAWALGCGQKEAWLVSLLNHIVRLEFCPTNCESFQSVRTWILTRLGSTSCTLTFKSGLLPLIPVLTNPAEERNDDLKQALQELRNQHFPLKSSEFQRGTDAYLSFVRAFEELLKGMVTSGSCVVLHSVIKMIVVDPSHACAHLLPNTLSSFMARLKNVSGQETSVLMTVYNVIQDDSLSVEYRRRILNDFLLPLMRNATVCGQTSFAVKIIKSLVKIISERLVLRDDANGNGQHKLVSRIIAWNLCQQIFNLPMRSLLDGKGSDLVRAAFDGTDTVIAKGNELVVLLTKKAMEVMSAPAQETGSWSNDFRELHRLHFCSAYNTVATLICNLKTSPEEAKFYIAFLFQEKQNRYIWRNIVDDTKNYMQPYEYTSHMKLIKQLVCIRRQARIDSGAGGSAQTLDFSLTQSQSGFAGTLEEDITRFDFTHSKVLPVAAQSESDMEVDAVELENDSINEHECMAMLCGIIRHMHDYRIGQQEVAATAAGAESQPPHPDLKPPAWMLELQSSILDPSCPRNACIFLLKLILNCEAYFARYAVHWVQPILDCLVKHFLKNKISYLLADLVALLIKWSPVAPPNESHRAAVNKLLLFLIEKCYHQVREVLKFHLELVRGVVEVWGKFVDPPFAVLFNTLDSIQDKRVGINLTAIMLINNLTPWNSENKKQYLTILLKSLQDHRKEIFKASAETVGMCLKALCRGGPDDELASDAKEFFSLVVDYLKNVHLKLRDTDRFLTILYAIFENFPRIVESFRAAILFYLAQTTEDMKAVCLNLISACLDNSTYSDLKACNINSMLFDRNVRVQLAALQALSKLAPSLPEDELLGIIQALYLVVAQKASKEARELAYGIALYPFDQYSAMQELNDTESELLQESKALLLLGLVDPDVELRKKRFMMFTQDNRLPQGAPERLTTLLSSLYSPATEQHFLEYGVPLMLEGTASTPDFDSVIFTHALDECAFEDYPLLASWRAKHAPMAPMFAESLASQMSKPESLNESFNTSSGLLLATQNTLMFEPTQDAAGESSGGEGGSIIKSSFMFSQATQSGAALTGSRSYKQGAGFGTERLKRLDSTTAGDETDSGSVPFQSRRFHGKHAVSRFCAMSAIRKTNRREELRKERIRKREGQVAVFRKYRKGDFPDIQLKASDFIRPLKELVKLDSFIGRKVLVSLFVGVRDKLDAPSAFPEEVSKLLSDTLSSSKSFDPGVVGCILEIAYKFQLQLDSQLIASASRNSGHLSLGVLLLESHILSIQSSNGEDMDSEPEGTEELWVHLAELYDALGEKDVAHAILYHNIDIGQSAKKALKFHSDEQWMEAKSSYFDALAETKMDIFYESCFECMMRLSEWSEVKKVVREQVDDNLDNLWEETWYEEKLLPRLLHSELLNIIQTNRDDDDIMSCLKTWLKDEEKGPRLKERFSEKLSMFYLLKKNFPQARFYASRSVTKFVESWCSLSPLSVKQREFALFNVQHIAEVLVYLTHVMDVQSLEDSSAFVTRLEKTMPAARDLLSSWETRINYRSVLMNLMPDEVQEVCSTKDVNVGMHLDLIEAALQQRNQIFAKKYIALIKPKSDTCDASIKARWLVARCRERHQWIKPDKEPTQRLHDLLQIWRQLDKIVATNDLDDNAELSVAAHKAESDLSCSVRTLLNESPEAWTALGTGKKDICSWLTSKLELDSEENCSSVVMHVENLGLRSLIHSKNVARNCEGHRAEAYFEVAHYCRTILETSTYDGAEKMPMVKSLVRATLSAMQYGSTRARQLFPLLLQLPNFSGDLKDDFIQKSANVPEWMFLAWIPQILSMLDTPAANVVAPLLLRIASKYPNAVSYPYNLTRENFRSGRGRGRGTQTAVPDVVHRLDSLLEASSMQMQFIRALSCLSHPNVILGYHLRILKAIVQASKVDWNEIREICEVIESEVLPINSQHLTENATHGKFFQVFKKKKIHTDFDQLCGAVRMEDLKAVQNLLSNCKCDPKLYCDCNLFAKLKNVKRMDEKDIKTASKLKDFSPWLANFSASKFNTGIEIPGQYTGDQRPIPERHIRISRFDDTVTVMPSIRRPVRLTIVGSDAVNKDFLVKFGEDLRQDERVQQLFGLMNGIFHNNQHCRQRRLLVHTYKVIPLSTCLGMIEWVNGTVCLKDVMKAALTKEEEEKCTQVRIRHLSWITKDGSISFEKAHVRISRERATVMFNSLAGSIRADALRQTLLQWSSSSEAFYVLRHSFMTSYSAMCIADWLLGIGDRHQSNCLVSSKNGKCVGIDFGHVFGTGTQFLPVPELVPFRMTPHILGLMQPFGQTGLIEESMAHCLRALRADPEVLLATMQVFIQEPSLDWLLMSRKQNSTSVGTDSNAWLPKLKVDQASRKLKGVNPVVIFREDFQNGVHSKDAELLAAFNRTLEGDKSASVRARLPDSDLTVRQQVECLLDLATDADVLAKTWSGWEPYM